MDAIENRKVLGPNVEAMDESGAERKATEEKAEHDWQIENRELENETDRLEQRQHVLDAGLTTNAGSGENPGSEWDPWKLMILRRA